MGLPLVPHMRGSTEDIFLPAPQRLLAKSPAIPKFCPSPAYLPAKSIHISANHPKKKPDNDDDNSINTSDKKDPLMCLLH